jgi:hypothetical protein
MGPGGDTISVIYLYPPRRRTRITWPVLQGPRRARSRCSPSSAQRPRHHQLVSLCGQAAALELPNPALRDAEHLLAFRMGEPLEHYAAESCIAAPPPRAAARAVELGKFRKAAGECDGRSSESARAKHRELSRSQNAARAARPVTPNPQQFTRAIWPRIRGVSTERLAAVAGMTVKFCRAIRAG